MTGKEREADVTEHEVMPRLPTSGQILGVLVTRLGIRHDVLQSRTTRRYFAADPEQLVKDSTREEIIGAIAEVLTDTGFVSSPQVREDDYELGASLASMLQWNADNWDLMRSFMRRRTMRVLPGNLPKVWEAYVRLSVVDLALRVGAHLHLAGSSPAALDFLGYASRTSRGEYLNQMRRQAGITLEDLAEKVDVDDHTVDAWMYGGARPSNDNLSRTAEVLAASIDGWNASGIALELQALYWISDVAGLLAEHIGAKAVEDAVSRLHKFADGAYHIIEDQFPVEARTEDLTVLADLGVGARVANPLLVSLIENEPDYEWREDLRSIGIDWVFRILSANLHARLAGEDELTKSLDKSSPDGGDAGNPEAYSHYRRSLELKMQGKPREAADELERAIQIDPLDARYHYALGSMKTGAAMWTGRTPLVDEGLNSLWMAVAIEPDWTLPWTEIGSTLHHTGRPEEAVEHLRNVSPDCGSLDADYYSVLGAAYWKVGKLTEALTAFEASVELDPEEPSALLAASELALLIGDDQKHRNYLRRARHFGAEEDTLRGWEQLREFGQKDGDLQSNGAHESAKG